MIRSPEKGNFQSHSLFFNVYIFGKGTAGPIGDVGGPDLARGS